MTEHRTANPPGMWSGFYGRLPDCVQFTPRMGLINGMELHVDDDTLYPSHTEAMAAGRRAAWSRYDEWQAAAPEKTMNRWLADEALAEMNRQQAALDAVVA